MRAASAWVWSPPGLEDLLVHVDGVGALVEEVVHLAGAELGALAEPVAGVGLLGGLGVAAAASLIWL